MTMNRISDTFADVTLKDDKTVTRYRTKIIKSDYNPLFKHVFRFNMDQNQLAISKVLIYVYTAISDTQKCLIGFVDMGT